MSEEEPRGFLARWSQRKAASRQAATPEPPQIPEAPPPDLPPIESLGADSDYTVFLARGVSRAVQAQALRIAWASDPAIAGFRGMAEYAWDFNAPGYGALGPGDDTAAWLRQIVRSGTKAVAAAIAEAPAEATPAPPALPDAAVPTPAAMTADTTPAVSVVPPRPPGPAAATPSPAVPAASETMAAPAANEAAAVLPARRRHGGALPV